jgi:hypothetical protein
LAVLDLSDPGAVSLLNTGNVNLLITDVQMYCEKEIIAANTQPIHQVVKAGEVLTVVLDNDAYGEMVPAGNEFTQHAAPNRLGDNYGVRYYSTGDAALSLFKTTANFKSVKATGVIFYTGTTQKHSEQGAVQILLEGVMMRRKKVP